MPPIGDIKKYRKEQAAKQERPRRALERPHRAWAERLMLACIVALLILGSLAALLLCSIVQWR